MSEPRRARQLGFTKTESARYRVFRVVVESQGYDGPYVGNLAMRVLRAAKPDGTYASRGLSSGAVTESGRVTQVSFELIRSQDSRYFVSGVNVPWKEFVDMGRKKDLVLHRTDNYTPDGKFIGKTGKRER
jgi:hypothetical protein